MHSPNPESPRPSTPLSFTMASMLALLVSAYGSSPASDPAPAAAATAGNWHHWRGPSGNGVSPDANPPLSWSPSKGVVWKVPIPGRGSASPVVWGDRIFVSTAAPAVAAAREEKGAGGAPEEGEREKGKGKGKDRSDDLAPHRFIILAIDRATGKTLWERVAIEATPAEGHHPDHGFASASPFTDGERVYAHFGSRGLFAFTMEGQPAWQRTDFGAMTTRNTFGEGSSPAIHRDVIVVPWDQEGPSWLMAIDKRTGKTIWKKDRDETSSWGTPLVVDHAGKSQVITTGEKFARGHDLATGEELWRCTGQTGRPIASPVASHGIAIVGSGFRGSYLGAFRLDARGDLKGTDGVAWSLSKHTPDVPSPLLSGKRVYFHAGRGGILSCHDVVSGKAHYSAQRVEGLGNVYASPVGAAGRIYLTARDGVTVAIADGDELKVLATSSVGEPVDATPALAGKDVFIRGEKHLFAIQ